MPVRNNQPDLTTKQDKVLTGEAKIIAVTRKYVELQESIKDLTTELNNCKNFLNKQIAARGNKASNGNIVLSAVDNDDEVILVSERRVKTKLVDNAEIVIKKFLKSKDLESELYKKLFKSEEVLQTETLSELFERGKLPKKLLATITVEEESFAFKPKKC
jgi:hypothetical protein